AFAKATSSLDMGIVKLKGVEDLNFKLANEFGIETFILTDEDTRNKPYISQIEITAGGKKRGQKPTESTPPVLKKKKIEDVETTTSMNVDSTGCTDLIKKNRKKPNKSESTISMQRRKKSVVASQTSKGGKDYLRVQS
ncbi:hypothetical protein C5167_050546, partial [Papaver somniferum]